MYKLVTLDITGTLLKFKKPIAVMYAEAGRSLGIEVTPEVLSSCFKRSFNTVDEEHPNFGLNSGLGWENWWKSIVSTSFKCALNIPDNKDLDSKLDSLGEQLINTFSTDNGWAHTEGSVDFLKYLKSNGACLGVISNFDPRLHGILSDMKIYTYFSFVITSYESKFLKPDPNIFKTAELEYEAVTGKQFQCSDALHIGNSLNRDYLGAKMVGWNAALVQNDDSNGKHIVSSEVSGHVFSNLTELKKSLFKV